MPFSHLTQHLPFFGLDILLCSFITVLVTIELGLEPKRTTQETVQSSNKQSFNDKVSKENNFYRGKQLLLYKKAGQSIKIT